MSSPRLRVIDSHTEGEPTRVVVEGGPNLGSGTLAEMARRFREEQTQKVLEHPDPSDGA